MSIFITKYIEEHKNNKDLIQIYHELKDRKEIHLVDILKRVLFEKYNFDVDFELKETEEREKRKYQQKLRKAAFDRYKHCVISNRPEELLLEAAHIKPVSKCNLIKEKEDIDNILLLWHDIHKYFDNYLVSINPETCLFEIKDNINTDLFNEFKNKKIDNLNSNTLNYLKNHYNKFKNLIIN
tara:strand:+ start:816 stop:1361 length:546 start_codon:yes stop_codon:yes gene_type:complete